MKAAHTVATGPEIALETNRSIKHIFILILTLLLASSAIWQFQTPFSNPAPLPYEASTLDLSMTGALNTTLSLTNWDTVDATFSPGGFDLIFNDVPLAFEFEFIGSMTGETRIYDLSGGTYPLRLTLLEGGESYHSFTATQGSVELGQTEATVTAFLNDGLGQQLFVNLRFDLPDASRACSGSYRFCFIVHRENPPSVMVVMPERLWRRIARGDVSKAKA